MADMSIKQYEPFQSDHVVAPRKWYGPYIGCIGGYLMP